MKSRKQSHCLTAFPTVSCGSDPWKTPSEQSSRLCWLNCAQIMAHMYSPYTPSFSFCESWNQSNLTVDYPANGVDSVEVPHLLVAKARYRGGFLPVSWSKARCLDWRLYCEGPSKVCVCDQGIWGARWAVYPHSQRRTDLNESIGSFHRP